MADQVEHLAKEAAQKIKAGASAVAAAVEGVAVDANTEALRKVHEINIAEIIVGQIGRVRGQSAEARDFGERLIRDHERLDQEVIKAAETINAGLAPAEAGNGVSALRERLKAMAETLRAASRSDFDKTFGEKMIQAHAEAIALIQESEQKASNGMVKDCLENVVPVMYEHKRLAEQLLAPSH